MTLTPGEILKLVARESEVDVKDLTGHTRPRRLTRIRFLAALLIRQRTYASLAEIGTLLGGRDHSTILHAVRRAEESVKFGIPPWHDEYRDLNRSCDEQEQEAETLRAG